MYQDFGLSEQRSDFLASSAHRAERTRTLSRHKRVWGHPHRHFGHVLRPPTPMFGPLGEPLKSGNKDFIRSLVNLFMLTH